MREPVDWPTDDLLAHRADVTPERTALVDADDVEEWTYAELDRAVDRLAGRLAAGVEPGDPAAGSVATVESDDRPAGSVAAVGPGDRIGVLLDTRVAFVELVHAAMRLRATLVPLNVRLTAGELAARIERVDLDCLVCGADTETAAVAAVEDAPVFSVDEAVATTDDVPPLDDAPPIERDWTQLILFTSGTTGEPKGVRLTAGNLVASATASAFRLGVRRDDRWLVPLPMYHMGGLAPVVRSALYGTAVVVQREFDAEATARAIDAHDATGVSLVPTTLARLLDAGWSPPNHLRFVLLGGAPASGELVARCRERGVPVYPTYGMTETASQVATATPAQAFEHKGTVGQPLVFADVTVVDDGEPGERAEPDEPDEASETGGTAQPGEPGEIVVDGPTVTPGYLDDERTREAFGDRGLHTGDVGYRDDEGRLWVLGRTDDAVLTGGETVHPGEVAGVLRAHPDVRDAAVVGLDDPEWGERVAALVVGDADRDALDAHCRERLAGYKVPRTWRFAEELPRTASGTVDREAVRERLAGDGV